MVMRRTTRRSRVFRLLAPVLAFAFVLSGSMVEARGGGGHSSGRSSGYSGSHSGSHSRSSGSSRHSTSYGKSSGSSLHSGKHGKSSGSSGHIKKSGHPSKNKCASCARDKKGKIARSEKAKHDFMKQTGHPNGWKGHVVDHKVPLKRGGKDEPSNMQWQTTEEAKQKDRTE